MQIRRPRGITTQQLMVVTAIGFLGGVYIWKPLILKWKKEEGNKDSASNDQEVSPKLVPIASTSCSMFVLLQCE